MSKSLLRYEPSKGHASASRKESRSRIIRAALSQLDKWDLGRRVRRRSSCSAHSDPKFQKKNIVAGAAAGMTPTRRCWSRRVTNAFPADGGEDDYAETWGVLFDAGGDARVNGISLTKSEPLLGKRAGPRPISTWERGAQRGGRKAHNSLCTVGAETKDSSTRTVRNLLHAETAG